MSSAFRLLLVSSLFARTFQKKTLLGIVCSSFCFLPAIVVSAEKPQAIYAEDVLASALTGEIALQRKLYPQAWRGFMNAARATQDASYAERAWESALAGQNSENARISLDLWRQLAPKDERANVFFAAENLVSKDAQLRAQSEKIIAQALAKTDKPTMMIAKIVELTKQTSNHRQLYSALAKLATPYSANSHIELLLASVADSAGLKQKAMQHALKASELAPNDARVLMAGADYEFRLNPQATTKRLRDFLAKHPDNTIIRTALAKALLKTGTQAQVKAELETANRLGGMDPSTLYAIGTVAEEAGLYNDAERYYRKYLVTIAREGEKTRYIPDTVYARLGMVKIAQNEPERALEWFSKVEQGDKYVAAKMKQAELLADMHRVDEACDVLIAIRTDTKQQARFRLAATDVYLRAGNSEKAYALSREALKLAPNEPEVIYKAAQLSETTNRNQEAEALLRHYIEIRPSDANGYNALGYMWLERGEKLEEAAPLIEKAMQLSNGKDGYITDSMGWLRYKQGNLIEAESYMREAFRLQPDVDIALHLAQVLLDCGKMQDGLKLIDAVLKSFPNNIQALEIKRNFLKGANLTP